MTRGRQRGSRLISLAVLLLVASGLGAAVALAGRKDPQLHPRKVDVKRAKKLLVTRGDLPAGFVDKGPQKKSSGPTGGLPCSLPSLHALVMTADVSSHDFVRSRAGSYAEVSSGATFFRRTAQAGKAVGVMTSHRIGSCLKRLLVKAVNKQSNSAKIAGVRLKPLSEHVGDLHAKLWDMFLTFKVRGLRFRDELVLAFFRRGRVVSSLMVNTINGLTQSEAMNISKTLTLRLEALPKSVVE